MEEGFQQYVNELRTRPAQAGENVRVENGKVSIQGVQGVMAINGIISKMIFDQNKEKFHIPRPYKVLIRFRDSILPASMPADSGNRLRWQDYQH